jgi:hypothetical protein
MKFIMQEDLSNGLIIVNQAAFRATQNLLTG